MSDKPADFVYKIRGCSYSYEKFKMTTLLRYTSLTRTGKLLSNFSPRLLPSAHQLTTINTKQELRPTTSAQSANEWTTIYRMPLVRLVSAFNRLKIYQGLVSAVGIPATFALEQAAQLPANATIVFAAVGISGLLTLTLSSFGLQNVIGIIYINKTEDQLKLSYVDYWGKRKNVVVNVDDLIPAWEEEGAAKPLRLDFLYQKVRLHSDDKMKYKLLPRFGVIVQPQIFVGLFGE